MDGAAGRRVKDVGASTVDWQEITSALSSLAQCGVVIVVASVDFGLALWLIVIVASN